MAEDTFVGRDGRDIYMEPSDTSAKVLTGARRCTYRMYECNAEIRNEVGHVIGHCDHKFVENDQLTQTCGVCGAPRKQCTQPALTETQSWDRPTCRHHLKLTHKMYQGLAQVLASEERRAIFDDILQKGQVVSNEIIQAMVAVNIYTELVKDGPAKAAVKSVLDYSKLAKNFADIKAKFEGNTELLETALALRKGELWRVQTEMAAVFAHWVYSLLDAWGERHIIRKLHKQIRKDTPAIMSEMEVRFPEVIEYDERYELSASIENPNGTVEEVDATLDNG